MIEYEELKNDIVNFYKGLFGEYYQCNVSCGSVQLQKSREGSFVPNKQNQRNAPGGDGFAEICFLRDD